MKENQIKIKGSEKGTRTKYAAKEKRFDLIFLRYAYVIDSMVESIWTVERKSSQLYLAKFRL